MPPCALVWIATSSQPSLPKLLSIRASLWSGIGATWYCHLVMPATLLGPSLLGVRGFVPGQHRDELADLALPGLGPLDRVEPVVEREAVRLGQHVEHPLGL